MMTANNPSGTERTELPWEQAGAKNPFAEELCKLSRRPKFSKTAALVRQLRGNLRPIRVTNSTPEHAQVRGSGSGSFLPEGEDWSFVGKTDRWEILPVWKNMEKLHELREEQVIVSRPVVGEKRSRESDENDAFTKRRKPSSVENDQTTSDAALGKEVRIEAEYEGSRRNERDSVGWRLLGVFGKLRREIKAKSLENSGEDEEDRLFNKAKHLPLPESDGD